GQAQQSTYSDFLVMRMNDSPVVETCTTGKAERPYGLGEQPVPPIAPAVANAIYAATGKRLRSLPFKAEDLASSSS
ncbi:MAG: xanthine dehydrogenase family protein molybdopterin-binding subunit, partial [bacterium]